MQKRRERCDKFIRNESKIFGKCEICKSCWLKSIHIFYSIFCITLKFVLFITYQNRGMESPAEKRTGRQTKEWRNCKQCQWGPAKEEESLESRGRWGWWWGRWRTRDQGRGAGLNCQPFEFHVQHLNSPYLYHVYSL